MISSCNPRTGLQAKGDSVSEYRTWYKECFDNARARRQDMTWHEASPDDRNVTMSGHMSGHGGICVETDNRKRLLTSDASDTMCRMYFLPLFTTFPKFNSRSTTFCHVPPRTDFHREWSPMKSPRHFYIQCALTLWYFFCAFGDSLGCGILDHSCRAWFSAMGSCIFSSRMLFITSRYTRTWQNIFALGPSSISQLPLRPH